MSKKSYGVFSWNVAKLCEAVSALEAEGHFVRGYEIPKFNGYPFVEHDVLIFLEYAPDVLESWERKAVEIGMKMTAEVEMPEIPRGYGEPTKQGSETPFDESKQPDEKNKSAPAKPAKKTG